MCGVANVPTSRLTNDAPQSPDRGGMRIDASPIQEKHPMKNNDRTPERG